VPHRKGIVQEKTGRSERGTCNGTGTCGPEREVKGKM